MRFGPACIRSSAYHSASRRAELVQGRDGIKAFWKAAIASMGATSRGVEKLRERGNGRQTPHRRNRQRGAHA